MATVRSRRLDYSESTREALVDSAVELFTRRGYAGTSLDEIARRARVTKGALYHHFSGKQALFEAVFEEVEGSCATRVRDAVKGIDDPWEQARVGLGAFLEVVQEPRFRRIVVQDGPAVLGYERFRAHEERTSFAVVTDIVSSVLRAGGHPEDPEMTHTFAQIFTGALNSAGEQVASASNATEAAARVETAIGFILTGLQSLADQGVQFSGEPVT